VDNGRTLMTVKLLAKYLALSEKTIYRMISLGTLPALKVGGQWRFDPKEVKDWVQNGRTRTPTTSGKGLADDECAHDVESRGRRHQGL